MIFLGEHVPKSFVSLASRDLLLHAYDRSAFLVAVVELCERFAYYGLAGPLQNYIANKYHDPNGLPGAIGTLF